MGIIDNSHNGMLPYIEIPTMLQPKNMVVPSKQQPGDNRVFETVTGLFRPWTWL